jgi:hypothetical protein
LTENINEHAEVAIGKMISRQTGSRAIIIGNRHVRGVAIELKHKLGKSFEVVGAIKPGSNTGAITFSPKWLLN